MTQHDWSKFSLKIHIDAPITQVYDAWTLPAHLEEWFLRKAAFTAPGDIAREKGDYVQKGDTYEWMWHGHPDSVAEHGVVSDANGTDRFRFVFGKAGIVTVQLVPHGRNTEIQLSQEHIPTDEDGKMNFYVGCSYGWTFYLANLKCRLEGGPDLRNKDEQIKGVINS